MTVPDLLRQIQQEAGPSTAIYQLAEQALRAFDQRVTELLQAANRDLEKRRAIEHDKNVALFASQYANDLYLERAAAHEDALETIRALLEALEPFRRYAEARFNTVGKHFEGAVHATEKGVQSACLRSTDWEELLLTLASVPPAPNAHGEIPPQ